jgi:hypothetical protein
MGGICDECGKKKELTDNYAVCPWTKCWDHPCAMCWDAHLAMHILEAGNEDGIVRPYYNGIYTEVERTKCIHGKPASGS